MPTSTANPSYAPGLSMRPALMFFVGCFIYSLVIVSIGWNNPILDDHAFRQTQTAISTYYMVGHWPTLAYDTPVLGPPWSIPFEFPLFQWLVAAVVTTLGTPLDQTGRLVSLIFFYLTLLPSYYALGIFKLTRESRLVILSLLLVSPFYLFWSRTFMMESTAVFFGMSYLALTVANLERPRAWLFPAAMVCGILAALVKITTFAVFLLAVLIAALAFWRRQSLALADCRRLARWAGPIVLLMALPVAAGLGWTHFADEKKELNQLGQYLTASALKEWNLGTFEQRWSLEVWSAILDRLGLVTGHLMVLAFCGVALTFARRRQVQAGICLFLALSAPLLLINLHFVHEYYAYANGIFLLAAVGLTLAALIERGGAYQKVATYLLVGIVSLSVVRYWQFFYPKQTFTDLNVTGLSAMIRNSTRPEDVILIVGCDWSSEIPYYSQRRALMVPDLKSRTIDVNSLPELVKKLECYSIGAVVARFSAGDSTGYRDSVQRVVQQIDATARCTYSDDFYSVYTLPQRGSARNIDSSATRMASN